MNYNFYEIILLVVLIIPCHSNKLFKFMFISKRIINIPNIIILLSILICTLIIKEIIRTTNKIIS